MKIQCGLTAAHGLSFTLKESSLSFKYSKASSLAKWRQFCYKCRRSRCASLPVPVLVQMTFVPYSFTMSRDFPFPV